MRRTALVILVLALLVPATAAAHDRPAGAVAVLAR
jgi:hypothetical protein